MFFQNVGLHTEIVNLPLTRNAGCISSGLHNACEGHIFIGIKVTATSPARHIPVIHPPIAEGILAGHEGNPCRGALRHGVRVVKLHARLGQRINMRRLDVVRAVTADPVLAQIVDHDEEDVGRRACRSGLQLADRQADHDGEGEYCESFHEISSFVKARVHKSPFAC